MSNCNEGPCDQPECQAKLLLRANGLARFAEFEEAVAPLADEIKTAAGKCPQACGKQWPACCCPTAGMKRFAQIEHEALAKAPQMHRRKESIMEMMARLGGQASA